MISSLYISERETSYYSHRLYHASYCITPVEHIDKRLREGFMPTGPIFYNPKKKLYYQAFVKHNTRAIKKNKTIPPQLDEREKKCLDLVLKEYSNKDISNILSCSTSTIEKIISNLRKKFSVKKNTGLVREAIRYGFDNYF